MHAVAADVDGVQLGGRRRPLRRVSCSRPSSRRTTSQLGDAVGRERGPGRRRFGRCASRTAGLPASTSYVVPVSPAQVVGVLAELGDRLGVGVAHARPVPSRSSHRWTPSSTAAYVAAAAPSRRPRSSHQRSDTPSPPPACSSKFSCSSRCRTGTSRWRRALEVQSTCEELGDEVLLGEDDRLAPVDLLDLGGERVDRVAGDQLAGRARAGGPEHVDRVGELALGVGAGLLARAPRGRCRRAAADVRAPGRAPARRTRPWRPATRARPSSSGSSTW